MDGMFLPLVDAEKELIQTGIDKLFRVAEREEYTKLQEGDYRKISWWSTSISGVVGFIQECKDPVLIILEIKLPVDQACFIKYRPYDEPRPYAGYGVRHNGIEDYFDVSVGGDVFYCYSWDAKEVDIKNTADMLTKEGK